MKDYFYRCDGSRFDIPLFDHVVTDHFNNPATLTDHLIDQMGDDSIYHKMFKQQGNGLELRKDLVFLDIGANIGLISLYAVPACKRIVALEPAPNTFPVLRAMTLTDVNIECHQVALASTNGDVPFHLNDINPTASSIVNTYGKLTTVTGMTLSSILNEYQLDHVDVCKIDVEGSEADALAEPGLDVTPIQSFYIETHNCPDSTWEFKMGYLVQKLSILGYHKMSIDGMTLYATK